MGLSPTHTFYVYWICQLFSFTEHFLFTIVLFIFPPEIVFLVVWKRIFLGENNPINSDHLVRFIIWWIVCCVPCRSAPPCVLRNWAMSGVELNSERCHRFTNLDADRDRGRGPHLGLVNWLHVAGGSEAPRAAIKQPRNREKGKNRFFLKNISVPRS